MGAIILCAMLKVTISNREKAHVLGLGDTLPRVAGRPARGTPHVGDCASTTSISDGYAIFALLALLQGTLVCLGDMYFLGVQANHALQFLAVGWLAALVFSNIVYTLTVSFGDIGKAVAVVLLVMQVAGSGGTFPIETLPKFFQMLYPFLPFPHAIDPCTPRWPDRTAMSICLTWCISPCSDSFAAAGIGVAQAGDPVEQLGEPQSGVHQGDVTRRI